MSELIQTAVVVNTTELDRLAELVASAASAVDSIAAAVRPFREAQGLPRRALAAHLGVKSLTESTLAAIEVGNRSLTSREALALLRWMKAAGSNSSPAVETTP